MGSLVHILIVVTILEFCDGGRVEGGANGVSYHKFSGPVSGEVREVMVPSHGGSKVDYVAKPDYSFSYGVRDPHTGNSQEHHETRDGDAVHGQYKVLQSDGTLRVVRYVADPVNGFQAFVEYH